MNQNVAAFQQTEENPAMREEMADDELSEFELEMVAAGSPTNCVGGASSRV